MVEAIEARPFELPKTIWNDAAPRPQGGRKPRTAADAQAVGQQVAASKRLGVPDHLLQFQPDGRIVSGHDGAGADADDRVERHTMPHELPKNAGVRGATKAASAQDEADAHLSFVARGSILRLHTHCSIGRSSRCGRNLGFGLSSPHASQATSFRTRRATMVTTPVLRFSSTVDISLTLCKIVLVPKTRVPTLPAKEALILELLVEKREMYGLELVAASKRRLKRGTVYVTLGRMEEKGFIASRLESRAPEEGGLPRRLYEATAFGRRVLSAYELAERHLAPEFAR